MKIMWIDMECPYPPNSGGRICSWKRIEALAKKHEIYLYFASDEQTIPSSELDVMQGICKSVKYYPRQKGIGTLLKALYLPYPVVSRANAAFTEGLLSDYRELAFDFVMVSFPQMLYVLPEEILCSRKVILHQHNMEYQALLSLAERMSNPVKRLCYKYVSRQMKHYEERYYKSNHILLYTFVSTWEKEDFENTYHRDNTYYLPTTMDISADVSCFIKREESGKSVIFVGKMSYAPNDAGAKWLITDVFPLVRKKMDKATLTIVGKEPSGELLELGETKKDEGITVTGEVESTAPYYEAADVVAIPIMSGGGIKVKLLEALSQGKLVVTTTKGLEGTPIGEEHVLIADTAEAFASALIEGLEFPDRFLAMRQRAVELMIETFSNEKVLGAFEEKLSHLRES